MQEQQEDWIREFYRGLTAYEQESFPKTCAVCGRTYENADDYFRQTESIRRQTGLTEFHDDDGTPIVSLYRNCVCGSTLLADFYDRRDLSEHGKRRRDEFDHMLNMLEQKSIKRETARQELLKVLRGGRSDMLEALGLDRLKNTPS